MKKFHAMIWLGVALVAASAYRLLAPFSTSVGTLHTSCGNTIAYLDGQDNSANFVTTLSVCSKTLKTASYEGIAAGVIGLVSFVIGLVIVRKARRLRRPMRASSPWQSHDAAFTQNAPTDATGTASGGPGSGGPSPEVYEQFMRLGRLTRPRTVLSFFGILFAALVAGSVVAISLFLKTSNLTHYIPWILVFDALVTIILIIGVFITITKDPARLMLSEITNQNAVALGRGRGREDLKVNEPVTVTRVPEEERREVTQFRRRLDDPQE